MSSQTPTDKHLASFTEKDKMDQVCVWKVTLPLKDPKCITA